LAVGRPPQSVNKIRLLHITVGLGWGGAERLMAETVSRLDGARFDTQILALKAQGPVGELLAARGLRVTTLAGSGPWDPRVLLGAARFFKRHAFDIVHAHLFWAHVLSGALKKSEKVVWHFHDTGEWMSLWHRALERSFISRSDGAIAISRAVADGLIRRHPSLDGRVFILPNAAPPRHVHMEKKAELKKRLFGFDGNAPVVGFVGRLDEGAKGLNILLKAAEIVVAWMPNFRLVLIGDGPARAKLERTALLAGLRGRTSFLGGRADVEECYGAFDVLVLPSLREGFGIVLLEAMAAALPVVASRIGGIPEVVVDGETGILVPPADAEALARALHSLLADPERAEIFGQKGRERAREFFDFDDYIKRLERFYVDTAGRGR
jgi:glycosyltransferase involved in cell wall biosynthesis